MAGPSSTPSATARARSHPEAADLTHGGDPGVERVPQIAGAAGGPQRQRLQRQPAEVERARAEEMAVAVPQPGQDGCGPVPGGVRRLRRARGGPRVTDPVAVEHHHPVADGLAAARNEQVSLDPVHAVPPYCGAARAAAPLSSWGSAWRRVHGRRTAAGRAGSRGQLSQAFRAGIRSCVAVERSGDALYREQHEGVTCGQTTDLRRTGERRGNASTASVPPSARPRSRSR